MMHSPEFEYKPLANSTSIRLVLLSQSHAGQSPSGTLVDVDLDSHPSYKALSYEWGSPLCWKQSIFVNSSQVWIQRNLFNALVCLQGAYIDKYLWIDALCINQHDVQERNHQVGLMDKIYSQATEVIVWLGPADPESDLAMSFIEALNGDSLILSDILPPFRIDGYDEFEEPAEEIRALSDWCYRSYWRRIWIIQEIQLATKVTIYCGSRSLPWEAFHYALQRIMEVRSCLLAQWEIKGSVPAFLDSQRDNLESTNLID
jgi:hypothetical protein